MLTTGSIIAVVIGLFIIFVGYLIWFRKKLNLIPGYNELTAGKIKDKDGLAKIVGLLCLVVGLFTIVMPFLVELIGETTASGIYTFVILGGIILVFVKTRKF